jgi:hypothetical protein
MAVFTELSDGDRQSIIAAYGFTSLSSVIGIADGDTDTTYLFRAQEGEFIVTLFENGVQPLDLERARSLVYFRDGTSLMIVMLLLFRRVLSKTKKQKRRRQSRKKMKQSKQPKLSKVQNLWLLCLAQSRSAEPI